MKKESTFELSIVVPSLEKKITESNIRIENSAMDDISRAVKQGIHEPKSVFYKLLKEMDLLHQEVDTILEPEIKELNEKCILFNLDEKTAILKSQKNILENEMTTIDRDIERKEKNLVWKKNIWIYISIILLCGFDSLANFQSIQVIANNIITAIVLSICIATGLVVGSHVAGYNIRNTENRKKKIIWFLSIILLSSCIFYYLGILRAEFKPTPNPLLNSPWLWLIFNNVFFIISVLLSAFFLPTKDKLLQIRELEGLNKDKGELVSKIKQLETEHTSQSIEYEELKSKLTKFNSYKEELHKKIKDEKERILYSVFNDFSLKSGNGNSKNFQPSKFIESWKS